MCDSEVHQHESTIIWKVKNFNFFVDRFDDRYDDKICSTNFAAKFIDDTSWTLGLYSKGYTRELGCFLQRNHSGPQQVTIGFSLYFVIDGTDKLLAEEISKTFLFDDKRKYKFKSRKHILMLNGKKSLLNSALLLKCHIWKPYPSKITAGISYVTTQIEMEQNSFIWAIKKFSSNIPANMSIPITSHKRENFDIEIKHSTNESDSFVQIDICIGLEERKAFYMVCRISVLDARGNTRDTAEHEHIFESGGREWRFPPFIEKSSLIAQKSLYIPDDILNLKFELFTSGKAGESKTVSRFEYPGCYELPMKDRLASDLLSLYTERKLNDVTLRAGNEDFPAHKSILGARSLVFDAMFQRDMLEKQTNFVDITDLDASTLNQLLMFIYSENLDDLNWEDAMKLYSDKYQMQNLKERCSFFLKNNVADSSVCELLIFADDYQDHDLKAVLHKYLCMFGKEVLLSEKWKSFMMDKKELANETMHGVSLQLLQNL